MAGLVRPPNKQIVDPETGRLALEWDAFFAGLVAAVNAVSQNSLVATRPYTLATVPSAVDSGAGRMIFVSDESGGPTLAFSDGTNWLRVEDLAPIT